MGLGPRELIMIGIVLLILFGPSQLPKLGRSIGQTIKEMRNVRREIGGPDADDETRL